MKRYDHVARAVFDTPWFIRETEGAVITGLVRSRLAGEALAADEIAQRIQAARAEQGPRGGGRGGPVAVIPVYGVLMQRANIMTEMSGGTSVQDVRGAMEEALRDKDIAAVVMEFDSPGGEVYGIEELAAWMRSQRGIKPVVSVVNTLCCSAAYYLAAQTDEIVATPSSMTGSIGTFMEHIEFSKAEETEGVKTTIIQQPANKHDINSFAPLTDVGAAHLQSIVDDYYNQFVAAVAKGRGVGQDDVRKGYGQGRELTAVRAKEAGLVDRIDTFENTVRRLSSGRGRAVMAPAAYIAVPVGANTTTIVDNTFRDNTTADPTPPFDWSYRSSIIDQSAALGAGLPFAERLSLVTASGQAFLEHAREHAEMRANAGRSISGETREEMTLAATTFRGLADALDGIAAPAPEPPASKANRRPLLEVYEAAARGGYNLPTN